MSPTTDPPSLARAVRESLLLPPAEQDSDISSEVEEASVPSQNEPPPEVGAVGEGAFVPTGHLVCEGCGRIVRWTVPEGARKELAITSPQGWEVRALAVSFTGYCPNCRRSPHGP